MTKRDIRSTGTPELRERRQATLWLDRGCLVSRVGVNNRGWLGYISAEVVGMAISELVHPDDLAQLGLWTDAISAPLVSDLRLVQRNGAITVADYVRYPRLGQHGHIRIDLITAANM